MSKLSSKTVVFLFSHFCQDVEIDIELAPGDQTAIPKTKEQAERDTGNQLHMLTNRHDKFLDSLREVKVRLVPLEPACSLSFSSVYRGVDETGWIWTRLEEIIHLIIM